MKKILVFLICLLPLCSFAQLIACRDSVADGYNFWLYLPDDYDATKADKPVVIFLHGKSLCGRDLHNVLRYGSIDALRRGRMIDAVVIAPQTQGAWNPEKVMNPKWKMKNILEESWDVNDDMLKEFGIQKSWLTRFPQELSGGELQRFSVLRSLNPNTKFLIADEMTTMLDAITQVQILDSVLKIVKERKMGFLLVSHDMDLVDTICDDKIYLKDINEI